MPQTRCTDKDKTGALGPTREVLHGDWREEGRR
jgi:hypothetical protein